MTTRVGSYTPSNDMMLKFYSFYKQATEGPCNLPKPSYWEPIKKAKWNSWNNLGKMPKEMAMSNYINELKKIIETMSFSEPVAEFMDVLGPFYEVADIKSNYRDFSDEISMKQNDYPFSESCNDVKNHSNLSKCNEANCIKTGIKKDTLSQSEESDMEEYADSCDQLLSNKSKDEINRAQEFNNETAQVDGLTENFMISELSNNGTVSVVKCNGQSSIEQSHISSSGIQALVKGHTREARGGQKVDSSNHGVNDDVRLPANLLSSATKVKDYMIYPSAILGNEGKGGGDEKNDENSFDRRLSQSDINLQVTIAIIKLQQDLQEVLKQIKNTERDVVHLQSKSMKKTSHSLVRVSKSIPYLKKLTNHSQ
ncbi:Acyl-CoA-binding domain-containing protein 5A [Nymphon striatum]|nr:Acyl-CoA-binding domain-containing protein 5A [Nymphon striatum]